MRERVEGREAVASNGSASSSAIASLNMASSATVQCLVLDRETTLLFCSGEDLLFFPNGSFSSNLSSDSSSSTPLCSSSSSFSSFVSSSNSSSSSSSAYSTSVSSPSYFSQPQSSSSSSSSSTSSSPSFFSSTSSSSSSPSSFERRIQILSVLRLRFCDDFQSLDVLDLDLVESNCVQSLSGLQDADEQVAEIYGQFERLLGQFDCEDQYSVRWNCADCKTAYKNWLCAIKLPIYDGVGRAKGQLPACRVFSEMVEEKCPYLSPHSQMQYAGEPAFSSLGAGSELIEDGDCYFLCNDDIARSMKKGASVRNVTGRICIHYGLNQAENS